MERYIAFADKVTGWFGKTFAWVIMVMIFGVSYEIFVRKFLNAPTAWAFDVSYIMYGTLFMMGGAYTLSRNAHVRADFIYRLWKPRTQAIVELVLYFLFFFPGVLALVFAGWKFVARSWRFHEVSIFSPAGVPVYQFKSVLIAAGILLIIQGVAQVFRCILCIRTGVWPEPAADVEELEKVLLEEKSLNALHEDDGKGVRP